VNQECIGLALQFALRASSHGHVCTVCSPSSRFTGTSHRVIMFSVRVVGLALHCPRRADSAKLAHVCWSGSSGGHHPSPGTAQPLYAADGHLLPAVCATGANSIVALRFAVPASPCRV
jgi:hypothetical protein